MQSYVELHRDDPGRKERQKENTTRYLSQPDKRSLYNQSAAERMRKMRQRKKEQAAVLKAIEAGNMELGK